MLLMAGNWPSLLRERMGETWQDNLLLRMLDEEPGLARNLSIKAEIDARSSDDGSRGRVILSGEIAGTQLSGRGGYTGRLSDMESLDIDVSLEAANGEPAILLRQLGAGEAGLLRSGCHWRPRH